MKIAVWHNLPSGGGKRALHGQVAGLSARGHQIEAWCPDSADPDYLPLSALVREHRLPFTKPKAPRGAAKFTAVFRGRDALLDEMDRHSQECAQQIRAGSFDLVFAAPCRFYHVPRLARALQGSGLPVLLYLQEPYRAYYEALPELPWLAPQEDAFPSGNFNPRRWIPWWRDFFHVQRIRQNARREIEDAKLYQTIFVNSYFSRESVARAYGLDARVCYLGYDPNVFYHQRLPRENFVLGLGSLNHIKGVDTAIRAIGRLPHRVRPPFVWVANTNYPAYLREMTALAAELQVDFEARFQLQDAQLVDLLNRTRLLLYTSRLEPFGYAPIEANACGAPVVAIAEGGIRETVIHEVNGILCQRDPAELANAILRLIEAPKFADKLGENGARIAAQRWSLDESNNRLEAHLLGEMQNARSSTLFRKGN